MERPDYSTRTLKRTRLFIGGRIRKARRAAGYRNADTFGEALGITGSQILKYETGKDWPNLFMLAQIGALTKRPLVWFLGVDEQGALPSARALLALPGERWEDPDTRALLDRVLSLPQPSRERIVRLINQLLDVLSSSLRGIPSATQRQQTNDRKELHP